MTDKADEDAFKIMRQAFVDMGEAADNIPYDDSEARYWAERKEWKDGRDRRGGL